MRLTVHHSQSVLPIWQNSLEKLLATHQITIQDAQALGDWHLASFNERVVGLAITKDNKITYFSVRDITRRRGIGRYLMAETIRSLIEQQVTEIVIETSAVKADEFDGLNAFLTQAGFHYDHTCWALSL